MGRWLRISEEVYRGIVVDDTKENLRAARTALEDRGDAEIDYASCCRDAEQMLNEGDYDFGIFDLHMPYTSGEEEGKLGLDLAQQAADQEIPWAILTSGIDHHNCRAAFVTYFWEPDESSEFTETPKTEPRAWDRAYDRMRASFKAPGNYKWKAVAGNGNLDEDSPTIKALKRFEKYVVGEEGSLEDLNVPKIPMKEFQEFTGEPELEAFEDLD